MAVAEETYRRVRDLPAPFQAQVLGFVERLASRAQREAAYEDGFDWSALSSSPALRGMEDEDSPKYSIGDLRKVLSR